MEKRVLAKIKRPVASEEMMEAAERLDGIKHIITAELIEDNKILLLNFFEVSKLKNGKPEAVFRTFLSRNDYITQDLRVSKTKWKTASFLMMEDIALFFSHWDDQRQEYVYKARIYIWSKKDLEVIKGFFPEYLSAEDKYEPWEAICRFQKKLWRVGWRAAIGKKRIPLMS